MHYIYFKWFTRKAEWLDFLPLSHGVVGLIPLSSDSKILPILPKCSLPVHSMLLWGKSRVTVSNLNRLVLAWLIYWKCLYTDNLTAFKYMHENFPGMWWVICVSSVFVFLSRVHPTFAHCWCSNLQPPMTLTGTRRKMNNKKYLYSNLQRHSRLDRT